MLAALRHGGFDAQGFDVRSSAVTGVFADAMELDPDLFARDLRVLISVVRDMDQTEAVLFGAQGFVSRAQGLDTIVISSTLSPRYTRDLRARIPDRIALVDAPMSGAAIRAERRDLSFMLGGSEVDLDRLQPLFGAMGSSFHRMGEFGAGMAAKVLNNLLAASHTAMTRLVLDWADAQGIDSDKLLKLIENSSGQNWFASGYDEIEFARDGYAADNTIAILVKDVQSALDAAPDGADTELPKVLAEAIRELKPRT
jgi:3-hydroxyisobutyrate dehydrogenase-like beta-hydroxyacid dehydrogenase